MLRTRAETPGPAPVSGILYLRSKPLVDSTDKPDKRKKKSGVLRFINVRWVLTITALSLVISAVLSYVSNEALQSVGNITAFLILLFFILLGIVFDIVGVAATSATEKEFHSMAAKKVAGAKQAVWLTQNAEKVSSFCNDVVGDISGIMSGATGAVIVSHIAANLGAGAAVLLSLLLTGMISAATIGGKAAGKAIGINYSVKILFGVGKLLSLLPLNFEKKK